MTATVASLLGLLSGPAFQRETGLNDATLHRLVHAGVIEAVVPPEGSGSRAFYAPREVEVFAALAPLFNLTPERQSPRREVLVAVARAVRQNPAVDWVRIADGSAEPCKQPLPDGALYLSVAEVQS